MAKQKKFDYEQFRQQAVQQLRIGETNMASIQALLAPVIMDLLEAALQPEDHSMQEPTETNETMTDEKVDFRIRKASPKHNQPSDSSSALVRGTAIRRQVISLFNRGVNYRTMEAELALTARVNVNLADLIAITDDVWPQIQAWRTRLLEPVYAYLWVSSIPFRLRSDGAVANHSACVVAGIDLTGQRDVLGYYIGGRQLSDLWPTLLEDLRARGVEDILIASGDEPDQLGEAFHVLFPQTQVHGCIMLQINSSLHYLAGVDRKATTKALRALGEVTDSTEAEQLWQIFKANWATRYPLVIESWERHWTRLIGPCSYPRLVRQCVHRFSMLETLQQELIRYEKQNGPYINEKEFYKDGYRISRKLLSDYRMGVSQWGLIVQQLGLVFGDRAKKHYGY